jgi:hypothetical protein
MMSRTQILSRLTALQYYKFVAYIGRTSGNQHKVRLLIPYSTPSNPLIVSVQKDFIVVEEKGYLSAIACDATFTISKLI